ncbi:chitinase [Pseudomonas sp. MM213]|uniref:glycosyl hydrolase family 18 protein n=1 Tax=Pseudomonas sp. MM213 TaxID=2866807 RepID=UPI001CF58158|nr:glycosyl hydrolase family 18 protein [Pseudomonas sp. MM213]UCP10957.1 chitinase [Pseudomonas sp. MM213]
MTTFTYTGPKAPADDASEMPDFSKKKVFMGFWHNWGPSAGYQGGLTGEVPLEDIPVEYNVVAVAFMKGAGIPTFKPYNLSDEEFRRQVGVLNKQGRAVLISLGGADAHIALKKGEEQALANEIIRLVEVYGFDGLDIDLEQTAIDFADNNTVIPAALIRVRDYYKSQGKHFLITMAPEFPYLRTGGKYVPYLNALANYFDWISPQYYNQAGDGLSVPELNPSWLTQNDGVRKKEFLYYLTTALVTGKNGFVKIPADKFLIGLPSSIDAAANGFVVDPNFAKWALDKLKADGNPVKGLMTWSINWDCGTNKNGDPYDWRFKRYYSSMIQ